MWVLAAEEGIGGYHLVCDARNFSAIEKLRRRDETLWGGVFQNRVLTEQVTELLRRDGFRVYLPVVLPCNDAALSFGQAAELAAIDNNR